MKQKLHLISTPWSVPLTPSAQVSALKAYSVHTFGNRVPVKGYAAHLSILYRLRKQGFFEFWNGFARHDEFSYLLLYYEKYLQPIAPTDPGPSINELIRLVNGRRQAKTPIDRQTLRALERCTRSFVRDEVLTELIDGLNVVGFTLNFAQTVASVFVEKLLRDMAPEKNFLFLYGGYAATSPNGISLLSRLGASGYRIIGEGEKKLESILSALEAIDDPKDPRLPEIDGVIPMGLREDPFERPDSFFASQFGDLGALPSPDFDDYFKTVASIRSDDPIAAAHHSFSLVAEGTRGCFAHCDFCSLNAQWKGFRKLPVETIFQRSMELIDRYRTPAVFFLDNVCDTWAEAYADRILQDGRKVRFFMELRAHHPERFWTKLSLAGMTDVQIGVEAVTEPLIRKIGKGTHAIQNLMTQKYLGELGVKSLSNLMTHHPKSSLEDVIETKRVLELTPHLPELYPVKFCFDADSPIFRSLSKEERGNLRALYSVRLPGVLHDLNADFGFELPPRLKLQPQLEQAWDDFLEWMTKDYSTRREGRLTVKRTGPDELALKDSRFGGRKPEQYLLKGAEAAVYDLCHRGPKIETLLKLGLEPDRLASVLQGLLDRRVLLEIGGHYLSLALRPRSELIRNLNNPVDPAAPEVSAQTAAVVS